MKMLVRLWRWLAHDLFPTIPILGPLVHCRFVHHRRAFREFMVVLVFSTATFWLTAIFLRAFTRNAGASLAKLFDQTVSAGQLFIFSVGFLGPILIAAGSDASKKGKGFPGRISHFLVFYVLGTAAAGLYALHLASLGGLAPKLTDDVYLLTTSYVIATASVILRYLTLVYKNSVDEIDVDAELRDPVDDFAERFAKRHTGDPP
jgi:hypothetical protein